MRWSRHWSIWLVLKWVRSSRYSASVIILRATLRNLGVPPSLATLPGIHEHTCRLMGKTAYKKFCKEDQKALATWAAECAERVLPLFEQARPEDDRPRKALEVCRTWVRTGIFSMAEIRGASLAAHAAARDLKDGSKEHDAAHFAARAAGQAVATAHVTQHAYGAAYYALKAVAAANPEQTEAKVIEEREWQSQRLPEKLRQEMMERIIIQRKRRGVQIKIDKSEGF
jgi:hypothetical protein